MIATPALRRLTREVVKLQKSPPDGIGIEVGEEDILDVNRWIQGPAGTPYADGFFKVNFQFVGTDFPSGPPKCLMRTKIFHPNIHANGEICVSTLKKDWNSTFGIEHILTVIKCLLISPNPDSALDPEAATLLQEAYDDYASTASIWTRIHASYRPACLPESINVQTCISSSRSFDQKQDSSNSKKMAIEEINVPMENALGAAAQPLARSGSTNTNLHHKASFDLQAIRAEISNNNGTFQQQQQCISPERLTSATILQTGTAAAAAAATTAAMTAAMTAGMHKVSLRETLISPSKVLISDEKEIRSSFVRKRVPIVRRGIKRL